MDRKIVPEISVVIPVYNEELHIADSVEKIILHVREVTKEYELILIDDGSTDRTWDRLTEIVQRVPHVRAIGLSRNFGKEMALCAGLEASTGRAVIVMDGDLQHPPALIPQMVQIWRTQGVEIVECVKRERGKEDLRNRVGAAAFYGLLKMLTGYHLQGASDFKLLDQKVVHAWAQMPEKTTFFRGMTAWLGFKKATVEFEVAPRINGETKWSIIKLTKLALQAVVSFTSLPLRFVSMAGIFFLLAAVVLGIQTLYHKLIGTAVTGFTTVILLQLMIGSVIMISLGIIGEYMAAIYNEVKGRPRYLIRETLLSENVQVHLPTEPENKEFAQVQELSS